MSSLASIDEWMILAQPYGNRTPVSPDSVPTWQSSYVPSAQEVTGIILLKAGSRCPHCHLPCYLCGSAWFAPIYQMRSLRLET